VTYNNVLEHEQIFLNIIARKNRLSKVHPVHVYARIYL